MSRSFLLGRSHLLVFVTAVALLVFVLGGQPARSLPAKAPKAKQLSNGAITSATSRLGEGSTQLTELPGLRSSATNTYERPDGTRLVKVYDHPVNYSDGVSGWQPVDGSLVRQSDGSWQTKASSMTVSLPKLLSEGGLSVNTAGREVALRLEEAGSSEASVSGAQGTYAAALPETSVTYAAASSSVRETLTLHGSGAPTVERYALSLSPGLHAALTPAGTVLISDSSGKRIYMLAAPTVHDASSGTALTAPVHYELSSDGSTLSVVLSSSWLHDPARVFPVTLDPDLYYTAGTELTCTIRSGESAGTSLCGQPLALGSNSSHVVSRIVSRANLSAIPENANILEASLGMMMRYASSTTPIMQQTYALSREITSSVTWNAYDGSHPWSTPGGDYTSHELPGGGSAPYGERELLSSYVGSWEGPNIVPLVQKWVREPSSNHGLIFKASNEEAGNYDEFDQPGYTEETHEGGEPVMEVVYSPQLGTASFATFASVPVDGSTGLAVNVADGNLVASHHDLTMPGVGYGFSLANVYNSLASNASQNWGKPEGDPHPWDEHLLAGMTFSSGADVSLERSFVDESQLYHDPSGAWWDFQRDPSGDKGSEKAFYSPPGLPATLVLHESKAATLTYNTTGLKYEFDSNGQLEKIVDANGNTTTFSYNSEGKNTGITDTRGNTLSLEYKSNNDISKIKDQLGREWKFAENTSNQMTSATNPDGQVTKYSYTEGHLTQITDPDKYGTVISYDSSGRVTEIRRRVNGSAIKAGTKDVITTIAYSIPVSGSVSCPTGSYGDTEVVSPNGSPGGSADSSPSGHETFYCFNNENQVTKTIDQAGNSSTTSYSPASGRPEKYETPGDTAGGLTGVSNTIAYNSSGAITEILEGTGEGTSLATTFHYSGTGTYGNVEPEMITRPYSSESQAKEHEKSNETLLEYDSNGNIKHVQQGPATEGGSALSLEHNTNGEVTKSTDADGHSTEYEYNATHDLTKIKPPAPLGDTEVSYDELGRVHTVTDGRGITVTYTYNGEDQVTKVEYSDGSSVSFEYDADGNVIKRTDASGFGEPYTGATTYEYDKLNRVISQTSPTGKTTTYEYDNDGNLAALKDAGGTVTYTHGPDDVLETITEPSNTSHPFKMTYDTGVDNRESITYPNGIIACYKHDPVGRVVSLTAFLPSGGQTCASPPSASGTLEDYTLSYKTSGSSPLETPEVQALTNDKTEATTAYSYDALERILKAITKHGTEAATLTSEYEYDPAGNPLLNHTYSPSSTYSNAHMLYNNANEICAIATSTPSACASPSEPGIAGEPTYDADGNMTSDGSTTPAKFAYTARDQLASITPHEASATQIVSHGTNQKDLAAIGTEEVIQNVLGVDVTGSGETASYYTRGSEGALLAKRTAKGTPSETKYYLPDTQGSVAMLTSSSGAQTAPSSGTYQYDPYGAPIGTAPSGFGYRGAQTLPDGLLHFGARYYDATLSAWTQQDPATQSTALSEGDAYAFAAGDPINLSDPEGTSAGCGYSCYPHGGGFSSFEELFLPVAKEIFGLFHCAYELYKNMGAGCGNP